MPAITYPSTLPPPVGPIVDVPTERRRQNGRPGPWAVAAWGRERTATVELQWILKPAEAEAFRDWFEAGVDAGGIAMGGAWWSASWPSVAGAAVPIAYQFLSEPRWGHLGQGIWRVSAQAQRRGGPTLPDTDTP